MTEIICRKRKHVAIILSSDDENPEPTELCKEENYDTNNLPDCKVVVTKMNEDVKKHVKKPRRIQSKFLCDSSDDESENSNITPSKIQIQRKRLEKLCRDKRNKIRRNTR